MLVVNYTITVRLSSRDKWAYWFINAGGAITNAKSAVTKTVTSWFSGFGNVFGKNGSANVASAVSSNVSAEETESVNDTVEDVHNDKSHTQQRENNPMPREVSSDELLDLK